MRPDIKLGIVVSMVVVFVAGSYFMYRANDEAPVSLASKGEEAKQPENQTAKPQAAKKKSATPAAQKQTPAAKRNQKPKRTALKPASSNANRTKAAKTPQQQAGRTQRPKTGQRRVQPKTKPTGNQLTSNDAAKPKSTPTNAKRNSRESQKLALQTKTPGNASPKRTAQKPQQKKPVSLTGQPSTGKPVQTANGVSIETHRAQPGDSFATLAQRYYGDARHARFLIDNNPHLGTTGRLLTGQVVKIPPLPATQRPAAKSASTNNSKRPAGRTYKVRSGDSFYKIAASQLGDASRWKELFELNKALVKGDPKRLQIGTVLQLPKQ